MVEGNDNGAMAALEEDAPHNALLYRVVGSPAGALVSQSWNGPGKRRDDGGGMMSGMLSGMLHLRENSVISQMASWRRALSVSRLLICPTASPRWGQHHRRRVVLRVVMLRPAVPISAPMGAFLWTRACHTTLVIH